jgi:SOS-response transcriptional repressor LexA
MNLDKMDLILEYLRGYVDENHYAPTRREISDATGVKSTSQVNVFLGELELAGLIKWTRKISRGIVPIEADHEKEKEIHK